MAMHFVCCLAFSFFRPICFFVPPPPCAETGTGEGQSVNKLIHLHIHSYAQATKEMGRPLRRASRGRLAGIVAIRCRFSSSPPPLGHPIRTRHRLFFAHILRLATSKQELPSPPSFSAFASGAFGSLEGSDYVFIFCALLQSGGRMAMLSE
jgi:hypothetical protein